MNILEKIIYFLQAEMPEPKPFGWFHCLWLILVIIAIIFLHKKDKNEKQLKIVLGTYGFIALVLELLKQIIWSFNYNSISNTVKWDFEWYAFPFQLCTTPIYVSLLAFYLKKGRIRNYLLSYISYITILGSISTMLLPESCFVNDILVNIHTMWLHLGSFVVSVYLLMSREVKIKLSSLKKAINIFIIFVFIANSINIIVYNTGILNGETFNMFYISPYFESSLPIFNIIQQNVPYLLFLLIYIIALSIGGYIIFLFSKILLMIIIKRKLKTKNKNIKKKKRIKEYI